MADAPKDRLHELMGALPESRFEAAKRALECLVNEACDPVLEAFLEAPEDDEPVTEEDLKDMEEGRRAIAEGRVKSWEEVKRELGQ
jgi:CHAD domain-containing protein